MKGESNAASKREAAPRNARGRPRKIDTRNPEESRERVLESRQTGEIAEIVEAPQIGEEADLVVQPGLMSEPNVRAALLQAKGDLFIAASLISVPAPHLDRCIRASAPMMAFAATIAQVKADPKYEKMSSGQFASEINRLSSQYALDGLNVIHELATGDAFTAAEKQVKLDAAVHLRRGAADRQWRFGYGKSSARPESAVSGTCASHS